MRLRDKIALVVMVGLLGSGVAYVFVDLVWGPDEARELYWT